MYDLSKRDEFIRQTLYCLKIRYIVMSSFWWKKSLLVICQCFFLLQGNEAIKYLEFCIEQLDNKDQAIHNYLLSLYAKLRPDQLMTYLNIQGTVRLLHIFCHLQFGNSYVKKSLKYMYRTGYISVTFNFKIGM